MAGSGQQHPQSPDPQTQVEFEEALATTPQPDTSDETGLMSLASHWLANLGSRAKVMVELVLAEARLAAISVALMAFLAMLSAAFVLGAWALLIAGLIYGLLQMGLPVWPILFTLCVVHALIAFLAWRGAVRLSNNLEFPITRQQFERIKEEADEVAESKT